MAREYPPPFKARADGSKPLNEALRSLMLDSRVQVWLLPSPGGAGPKPPSPTGADAGLETPPNAPAPPRKPRLRKKAKKIIPDSLKACKKFSKGPCCWAFNLEGCSSETKVVEGLPKCQKGFHVCMFCHKPGHSFSNCRAKTSQPKS